MAADIGTLQRLPKITGNDSLVRELALTGRNFKADEAERMGFVSRVIKGGRAEVVSKSCRLIITASLLSVNGLPRHLFAVNPPKQCR